MHTNDAKVMSVHAEAIKALVMPKVVKPKMPKGPSHKLLLSLLAPSLGSGFETTWPRVTGSVKQSPRFKLRERPKFQLGLCTG
jgi:large subunit ribosomal protein L29e